MTRSGGARRRERHAASQASAAMSCGRRAGLPVTDGASLGAVGGSPAPSVPVALGIPQLLQVTNTVEMSDSLARDATRMPRAWCRPRQGGLLIIHRALGALQHVIHTQRALSKPAGLEPRCPPACGALRAGSLAFDSNVWPGATTLSHKCGPRILALAPQGATIQAHEE